MYPDAFNVHLCKHCSTIPFHMAITGLGLNTNDHLHNKKFPLLSFPLYSYSVANYALWLALEWYTHML